MAAITIYSPKTSSRLVYVLDWLFNEVLNIDYEVVSNDGGLRDNGFVVSYGKSIDGALNIPDQGLLWEEGIHQHDPKPGSWNNIPTIFHQDEHYSVPFDLFSAIFFFISRYEEYRDFSDKHGRFPASASIVYKNNFLSRPVIDEWIYEFYKLLNAGGVAVLLEGFTYRPTYDIDIAYSYLYKGWKRSFGALVKDVITGNGATAAERVKVLSRKKQDPYDCFDWLQGLHQRLNLHPEYFILASLKTTAFDKNNSPLQPEMRKLIRQLADNGNVHIHPSYYSVRSEIFEHEKNVLEEITQKKIDQSRQHYIRMRLPDTYRELISRGIHDDWSMGFGDQLGFRAGTGRNFYWYDLLKETRTSLRIHPFCFMDSTAHFEEGLSVKQAFEKLIDLTKILQRTHSQMVTVFHNFSLGTDKQWTGWREAYTDFLEEVSRTRA